MSMQIIHRYIDALIVVAPSCNRLNQSELRKLKESCNVNRDPVEFVSRLMDVTWGDDNEAEISPATDVYTESEYMGWIFQKMFGEGERISDFTMYIEDWFDNYFVEKCLKTIVEEIRGPVGVEDEDSDNILVSRPPRE